MCPELLLLLLAALNSESAVTPSENSAGLKFIAAFPENIAYYHPDAPENKIRITALFPNTKVDIKMFSSRVATWTLNAGGTWEYAPPATAELKGSGVSTKTLQIISNNLITVHVVYLKKDSVQTTLLRPDDKLGIKYLVPPVPVIEGTTHPANMITRTVTERGPFRLIIINTDKNNKITVEHAEPQEVSLQPLHITQFLVTTEDALRVVKADEPVAVLFGHSCAIRENCTCGQLYTLLPPAEEERFKFYIPPFLAKDAEGKTSVLLSESGSNQVIPYNPNSPVVETAGTAVLYRPGALFTLIPEKDFGSCSIIDSIQDVENFAVILVHKDFTDGVRVGSLPLESPEWQQLVGTDFVSTAFALALGKNVIWHTGTSKMAVYFVGIRKGALFGNPAPIISKSPDFRGCILTPEVLKIGEVAGGWRESLKYCSDNNLELVSFPTAQLQSHIYDKIIQAKDDSLWQVWFGMRRSSQTGEWYWLSKEPANETNWGEGEPGTEHDGQCAIMSLGSSRSFAWSDEDCCKKAHPVCYKGPVLLPM